MIWLDIAQAGPLEDRGSKSRFFMAACHKYGGGGDGRIP